MKRSQIIAIGMAVCLFMSFALGSSSSSSDSTKAITGTGDSVDSTDSKPDSILSAGTKKAKPTIDEAVVYEKNGIKISAKEYVTDSMWGDGIKFLLENETEKNITVGITALIVNDFMINDSFVAEVAAGKKTNETMNLSSTSLNAAGIDVIGQIEVYFHIYDSDNWDEIANTDCITIKTSMYDQMDKTVDDAGQVLYEKDGIKIVGKYVNESSFWGAGVVLYIENNTDKNVLIQVDNFSVNGFTLSSAIFSCDVYAGKKAVDDITLLSSELEENDIKSVDEVTLKFVIINPDTFDTIAKSDEINFKTK